MTKTILLTDLIITSMEINYELQYVRVTFSMVDGAGISWETHLARFWVTLPANPTDYDLQLPSGYIPTLVQLRVDADQALTNKFLV